MKKILVSAAIAAAIAGGALSGASPAQAGVGPCYPGQSKTGYTVACRGAGQFQAWANCRNDFFPWDYKHTVGLVAVSERRGLLRPAAPTHGGRSKLAGRASGDQGDALLCRFPVLHGQRGGASRLGRAQRRRAGRGSLVCLDTPHRPIAPQAHTG